MSTARGERTQTKSRRSQRCQMLSVTAQGEAAKSTESAEETKWDAETTNEMRRRRTYPTVVEPSLADGSPIVRFSNGRYTSPHTPSGSPSAPPPNRCRPGGVCSPVESVRLDPTEKRRIHRKPRYPSPLDPAVYDRRRFGRFCCVRTRRVGVFASASAVTTALDHRPTREIARPGRRRPRRCAGACSRHSSRG